MRLKAMLLLCALITTSVFTGARAQLVINPNPPMMPVCVEQQDAYMLADADMSGTLDTLWKHFVREGRCAVLPATLLYTISNYTSDRPSRIVEYVLYGKRVWGIYGKLPSFIWQVVDNGQWGDNPQWIRDWYKDAQITEAARGRLGFTWKSCCDHADVFRTQFRVNKDNGDDEWWYMRPDGTWKLIPSDIIHWGETAPDKRATLFIYNGVEVCFWPPEGGI